MTTKRSLGSRGNFCLLRLFHRWVVCTFSAASGVGCSQRQDIGLDGSHLLSGVAVCMCRHLLPCADPNPSVLKQFYWFSVRFLIQFCLKTCHILAPGYHLSGCLFLALATFSLPSYHTTYCMASSSDTSVTPLLDGSKCLGPCWLFFQ